MSEAHGFAHPEFLAETDWLAAHLDDPDLVVLDCTTHLIPDPKITYTVKPGREDFEKGHIPGAQFVDLQADLSAKHPKLRFMLPSAQDFAAAMGRFGIGDNSRVILYSTTTPQWAARIWWMLRNYGFDNAAVLNGGFQKWAREGRPVETGPALPRPPTRFTVREDRHLMVGKEAVRDAVDDTASCTINALSAEQHAGSGGNTYGRPGRIAKSVNVPAASLIDPQTGVFLPAPKLRAKFDAAGAFDKPRVITYCGGGIAASADALALVMLGHPDVRLYDASMSEWANDPSLPMERG
ncbi:MAG: sulfurtransferase [Alphaproteobacteria bacterium]|nr:sulfurtransferase [Alphaproteobacteria bacterium]MBV9966544.1 sulfurtransferase [Alphaproteobacteria bacterium]